MRELDRREALAAIGGIGVAAVLAAACSSDGNDPRRAAPAGPPTSAPRTVPPPGAPARCTLTPELTEGPFYIAENPERSYVVEDRPGIPLALVLTVVTASCKPLRGATVDIWSCDPSGVYGGVEGGPPGATWLRGHQEARPDGRVRFTTIYPGSYPGRAVHIHVKVFAGEGGNRDAVHTGQLFFPDSLNETVLARAPYRGHPDTTNATDAIYRAAPTAPLLAPVPSGDGYAATAQLVVQT